MELVLQSRPPAHGRVVMKWKTGGDYRASSSSLIFGICIVLASWACRMITTQAS